jgi:hypothetical protein
VLLYELLTGVRPFDAFGAGLGLWQATQEVPPPSARFAGLAPAEQATRARSRGTEGGALRQALAGDLDAVLLKALERDRDRRYATANDLAQDLSRYLRDEPVTATQATRAYRLRKFVRRHRIGVAFSGVLLALLVVFAVTAAEQARRLAAARRIAVARQAQAERLVGFMLGDLQEKLAPIGRLDVLDAAGAAALAYFATVPEAELSNEELARAPWRCSSSARSGSTRTGSPRPPRSSPRRSPPASGSPPAARSPRSTSSPARTRGSGRATRTGSRERRLGARPLRPVRHRHRGARRPAPRQRDVPARAGLRAQQHRLGERGARRRRRSARGVPPRAGAAAGAARTHARRSRRPARRGVGAQRDRGRRTPCGKPRHVRGPPSRRDRALHDDPERRPPSTPRRAARWRPPISSWRRRCSPAAPSARPSRPAVRRTPGSRH